MSQNTMSQNTRPDPRFQPGDPVIYHDPHLGDRPKTVKERRWDRYVEVYYYRLDGFPGFVDERALRPDPDA